jgi:hypothetical protein
MKHLVLILVLACAACDGRAEPPVSVREHVELMNAHAALLAQAGDLSGAIALARRVVVLVEQELGPKDPNLAVACANLAGFLAADGRGFEADAWARRVEKAGR